MNHRFHRLAQIKEIDMKVVCEKYREDPYGNCMQCYHGHPHEKREGCEITKCGKIGVDDWTKCVEIKEEKPISTLLIDDDKNLPADRIARTYADGIKALQEQQWDVLLLDHDLGTEKFTGMDILKWIQQNPKYLPKEIVICSMNPPGIDNMVAFIRSAFGMEPTVKYKGGFDKESGIFIVR